MIEFLFEFFSFILFIITCLYLPGKYLISRLKLELQSPEDLFFPIGLGLLIFTLISYIFSWFRLEILILPGVLVIDYLLLKSKDYSPKKIDKKHVKPLLLVIFLSLLFSLSMLVTGRFGNTLVYRHDDPWHLALINELKANFPPNNPGASGVPLKGYHFFYNFVLAKISNIFFIPTVSLHFHFIPLFIALMWGLGVYVLMFAWTKKVSTGIWAVFLSMFGGSFAFVLLFQGHAGIGLNNGLGMQQPANTLYNPPLGISIVVILVALFAFHRFFISKQKNWLIPFILSVGLISMFKVYAGMIMIGAFIFLSLLEAIKRRFVFSWILLGIGMLFFATYWIFAGGTGYLIYDPLWPPHVLLQSFSWYGYDEKIYTFTKQHVIRGIFETEWYGLKLFILGNMGMRLIGIMLLLIIPFKKRTFPSMFATYILIAALISLLTPLFFIQSGKVFEIIQMTQYFLFFCSLFAAIGFSAFFNLRFNKLLKAFVVVIIIILCLPSTYEIFMENANVYKESISLSSHKFESYKFLEKQGDYNNIVLEIPPQNTALSYKGINSWYHSTDPSIAAFANKSSYLNFEFIDFPGIDVRSRIGLLQTILVLNATKLEDSSYKSSVQLLKKRLLDNKIRFVYSGYSLPLIEKIGGKMIYHNQVSLIYKINN